MREPSCRNVVRVSLFLTALLGLWVSCLPAWATCAESRLFRSYNDANPYAPAVRTDGCDALEDDFCYYRRHTRKLRGAFWQIGSGDPAVGLGVDSGSYPAFDLASSGYYGWVKPRFGGAYPYPSVIDGNWAGASAVDPGIDGCPSQDACMAVFLTDTYRTDSDPDQSSGYMRLVVRESEADGSYSFVPPDGEDFVLKQMPRPKIESVDYLPSSERRVTFRSPELSSDLVVGHPNCSPVPVKGYRIYAQQIPAGSLGPSSSVVGEGWTPITDDNGEELFTFGPNVVVTLGAASSDWVFAIGFAFADGFETPYVGPNSIRILSEFSCVFPGAGTPPCDLDCLNFRDLDGDGRLGECEFCDEDPFDDVDVDGVCGNVDNCPTLPNNAQSDLDGDRFGDACDNCPNLANPAQFDRDDDLEGQACDVDDGWASLRFNSGSALRWDNDSQATEWNVYRGDLSILSSGFFAQTPGLNPVAARSCGLANPELEDAFVPAPGVAVHYLVTVETASGESDLGVGSDGSVRPNNAPCP